MRSSTCATNRQSLRSASKAYTYWTTACKAGSSGVTRNNTEHKTSSTCCDVGASGHRHSSRAKRVPVVWSALLTAYAGVCASEDFSLSGAGIREAGRCVESKEVADVGEEGQEGNVTSERMHNGYETETRSTSVTNRAWRCASKRHREGTVDWNG